MIIKNGNRLKENSFKNEKELQEYFEKNMDLIIQCKFIDTEFTVGEFRIDSLAYDEDTKSFRIIEYKNVKNNSLVDQGYTYLKLLLERKADFVLKYNEITKSSKTVSDFDWSQSRIVFVSPVFTKFQLNATDFNNLPFDLIKVTKYENDIVDIDFIEKKSVIKISEIPSTETQKKVNKEIVVYSEYDHFANSDDNVKAIYEEIKKRVLDFGDIDIDPKKFYIAFKGNSNIFDIEVQKKKLVVQINMKKGTLEDPLKIAKDISEIGHRGNGDYRVLVSTINDVDQIISLLRQSYETNKK